MQQLAIRSLVWGAGIIALLPLPAIASNLRLTAPVASTPAYQPNPQAAPQPMLLAVTLATRTLRPGDEGTDVRALQRYLSRNGLYFSAIDGFYGQDTANAVATYQRIRDLPATGIADEKTLLDMEFDFDEPEPSDLAPAAPASSAGSLMSGSLGPGNSGSDVIALQQRLNAYGIPVYTDGIYGFETQQAVRTYQRVQGLTVTGNADKETLEAMGFSTPDYPYVVAILADETLLPSVQRYFPNAFMDRDRRGRFINIGSFSERFPAEARSDAAAARGFTTRLLYR